MLLLRYFVAEVGVQSGSGNAGETSYYIGDDEGLRRVGSVDIVMTGNSHEALGWSNQYPGPVTNFWAYRSAKSISELRQLFSSTKQKFYPGKFVYKCI